MTILTENEQSFFLSAPAIVFNDEHDTASEWAAKHIVTNKAIKWILAKYVEADNANSNGQYWTLKDLQEKQSTIQHSPMNVGHQGRNIVGTWTAAEMVYPLDDAAAEQTNPYIETLGAFWRYYFPEVMEEVQEAYDKGQLFVSMECQGDSITCTGPDGCGNTFDYKGPMDASYCEHVLERKSFRQINNPHFLAGALILPPEQPGWAKASVKEMALKKTDEQRDQMMQMIASETPELSPTEWEQIMWSLQAHADLASQECEEIKLPASVIGMQVASSFMAKSYQ